MAAKHKIPVENVQRGIAIIGPYGNVWADELFDKPEDAIKYLNHFWNGSGGWDSKKWRLVHATQTIVPDAVKSFPISDYQTGKIKHSLSEPSS